MSIHHANPSTDVQCRSQGLSQYETNRGTRLGWNFLLPFLLLLLFVCLFSGYVLSRFSRKQPQQCNNKKLVNESTHSTFWIPRQCYSIILEPAWYSASNSSASFKMMPRLENFSSYGPAECRCTSKSAEIHFFRYQVNSVYICFKTSLFESTAFFRKSFFICFRLDWMWLEQTVCWKWTTFVKNSWLSWCFFFSIFLHSQE